MESRTRSRTVTGLPHPPEGGEHALLDGHAIGRSPRRAGRCTLPWRNSRVPVAPRSPRCSYPAPLRVPPPALTGSAPPTSASNLPRSSSTSRAAVFLPMPGMRARASMSPGGDRLHDDVRLAGAADIERDLRSDAGDAEEQAEEAEFGLRREAVERHLVFAQIEMRDEADRRAIARQVRRASCSRRRFAA